MCTSMLGVGQSRTAEFPIRFEGRGLVGLGRGVGTPFKMVWVLSTPAKEPALGLGFGGSRPCYSWEELTLRSGNADFVQIHGE